MSRFGALRLAARGIRWRRWASVATFVVAVVASLAATLGPIYASSAEYSLARQQLLDASAVDTSVSASATNAGQTQFGPDVLLEAVTSAAANPALDGSYRPAEVALTRASVPVLEANGRVLGLAPVAWREHQCAAVPLVEGSCAEDPDEVMIGRRLAADADIGIGDRLAVGLTAVPSDNVLTVVGIYDESRPDPIVYALETPATAAPSGGAGDGPATLDELLIDRGTAVQDSGQVTASAVRTMEVATAPIADLPELSDTVTSMQAEAVGARDPSYLVASGLPELVSSLGPENSRLRSSILAVSAQVAVLVWFVLFLVVASATDERANEVAVAKLRGRRTRSTLAFAVAEPLILTTAAVPLGVALAWGATNVLSDRWFVPGTAVTLDAGVAVAAGLAIFGGLVACLLAGRKVLTVSVNDELRKASARRIVPGFVVDAVIATLAVVSVTQIRGGEASGLALLAPGLVSLTVALAAVRVLPRFVASAVRRTRASRRVAWFLSLRNVGRRPGGSRLVVLLTVAVGLAVFAVDGSAVAAEQRSARADAEVGAPTVVAVAGVSPQTAVAAVDQLDPEQRWAMTAVQVPGGGTVPLLAVDTPRLSAVSSWVPAPDVGSTSSLAESLRPPVAPAVTVVSEVSVKAELRSESAGELLTQNAYKPPSDSGSFPTVLRVDVRLADGRVMSVPMGPVVIGTQDLVVELVGCERGCGLVGFVAQSLGSRIPSTTTLTLTDLADAAGTLPMTGATDDWRLGLNESALINPDLAVPAEVTSVPPGGVTAVLTSNLPRDVIMTYGDHPALLPALLAPSTQLNPFPGASGGSYGNGLSGATVIVDPLVGHSVLPRLGQSGALVDLDLALRADPRGTTQGSVQVWLGPEAPPDALDRLAAAGLEPEQVETVTGRQDELAQEGSALPFPYFVMAAVLAVVLAGGALLVTAAVGARRRAYELAALRILGAPMRTLVAAGRRELLLLTVFGTIVGAAAGLAGAALVLPSLPATAPSLWAPDHGTGPVWAPVAAVVAAALVLAVVAAQVAAVRIARMSGFDRLRETQA